MRSMTLHQAKARYVDRFTMEHVPAWARVRREDGTYDAPHYASDAEWFANTTFPGESDHPLISGRDCFSTRQTWPLGKSLDEPFVRRR